MKSLQETPASVYALYLKDCAQHGARGAYARVGKMIGRSDESVRRWVHQQELSTSEVDPLKYQPPPFAYPPAVPRDPDPLPRVPAALPQDESQEATDPTPVMSRLNVPEALPHATIATAPVRVVLRRPMPQRHEVRWWRTVDVHPQLVAWVIAAILVFVCFPH